MQLGIVILNDMYKKISWYWIAGAKKYHDIEWHVQKDIIILNDMCKKYHDIEWHVQKDIMILNDMCCSIVMLKGMCSYILNV